MTQAHTPAPWSVSRFNDGYYALAGTYQEGCDERDEVPEIEDEANRLLIEAAPDMLEALKAALTWMETIKRIDPNIGDHGPLARDIENTRAAIAKAEGRQL